MIKAPFTSEQVESLNGFQHSAIAHPFTCGNPTCRALLVATESGWNCPKCAFTQDWAHESMADNSWQKYANLLKAK